MELKVIVFDFDGVIHDTFELVYGLNKKLYPEMSKELYLSYFEGNIFNKMNANLDFKKKYREMEFEAFKELRLEKTIRKEIEKLSKKFDLFIISSNSERNLNLYFENNNFVGVFKEIMAAETHKSKEEKFKMLFKKYNLSPENCIFVTDTLGDVLEANRVCVKSICVDFGFHKRERLEKGRPYKIVSDFKDIRKVVENLK
jgi:HAD superfamily hydrolase (TIGR01509 family)